MSSCPSCETELPEGARFCMSCGARLASPLAATEERKIVTTLSCDLIGSAALTDGVDPEDVDRLLGEYADRCRTVIEAHGGIVEKFIGDAVIGVFGVPHVHEDDPECAVRAALRLIEALKGLTRPDGTPLEARGGVNTGEALVRLDVDPFSGRGFLTGDAVNVAARLQTSAPPGSVVVGALTHELTQRAILYEELPSVRAKGKSGPVEAWLAVAPIARNGRSSLRLDGASLVGRDLELASLRSLLDDVATSSRSASTVIVGETGIGKSRLVAELAACAEASPAPTTWRQGHCLPYDEGVALLPLAEIIRSHAGILETDDPATLTAKLEEILPGGEDRAWFRERLLSLLGESAPSASQEEDFSAWVRYLRHLAARGPLVLVFEDLHWADDALLAFVGRLVDSTAGVPLLIVATMRPEVFDAHPELAAAVHAARRIDLGPLRTEEMERLIGELLGDDVAGEQRDAVPGEAVEVAAAILAASAGNPYYAEESARLYRDQGSLGRLPESVQGLLAARVDALSPDAKALLSDAAVVGLTFWAGAVAAVGGYEHPDVEGTLRELAARQFVRLSRATTMAGEKEYTFWHSLARDVAYQQLPRGARARKHAAAAAWLERAGGERNDELAKVIAHHFVAAYDLAVAAGDRADAREKLFVVYMPDAVRTLVAHGDLSLADATCDNVRQTDPLHRSAVAGGRAAIAEARGELESAVSGYAQAASGWREAGVAYEEGRALLGRGRCLLALGRAPEAAAPLAAAREIFVRLGARPGLAETDGWLAEAGVATDRPEAGE